MTDYLFVYGTLKRGYRLHHYLESSQFVSEGFVKGYRMYLVSWYPAVVRGDGIVYGEVYKIDDRTLKIIDRVEDEGSLYVREIENVETENGTVPCYIYIYRGKVEGLKEIKTGRF